MRISLNQAVVVHHDSVTLSDLLPPSAPENVRGPAMGIALGDAPFPGERLTLARGLVERKLREAPDLLNMLFVPPSIEVTRWSRPLTHEEVLTAIKEALQPNQLTVIAPLQLSDLIFRTNVVVTEEVPRLRVTRIEPSQDRVGAHVRLMTASEPRVPSFWVTLLKDIDLAFSSDMADQRLMRATSRNIVYFSGEQSKANRDSYLRRPNERGVQPSSVRSATRRTDTSQLIHPGARVQLIVQAPGLQLSVKAMALESGHLGQKVRVRNSDTGKILSGTVVSDRTIEADF